MLNDSAVLVCSGNTLLLELFRSKGYFMLECTAREVTGRFKRRNMTLSRNCEIFNLFLLHYGVKSGLRWK